MRSERSTSPARRYACAALLVLLGASRGGFAVESDAVAADGASAKPAGTHVDYPAVMPGTPIDPAVEEGSHPAYRVEWWYVTGWLGARDPIGFQVTFFRVRPGIAEENPSRFAPRQVLFAHAALADPAVGRLRHAQRSAREGFDLVRAREGRLDVRIDDWTLLRNGGEYDARIAGDDFAFNLAMRPTQPPLLQGSAGYSRKGPGVASASYYYSVPQLRVRGTVRIEGRERDVEGEAWFDHEWSSEPLESEAVGWDWTGVNFDDGGALMAFRMRAKDGNVRWAAATLRDRGGQVAVYPPDRVRWQPLATWRSPRTGASYPVRWRLTVGDRSFEIDPLLEDAELDSRASTGAIYWEGPVTVRGDATGRGYLELTGYASPLVL